MKNITNILYTNENLIDPRWDDLLMDDLCYGSLAHSGGLVVYGGRFPCPGEAPSVRGEPPLCAIMASPGAPRRDNSQRIQHIKQLIANGEYLNDNIIEETANKFLTLEIARKEIENE